MNFASEVFKLTAGIAIVLAMFVLMKINFDQYNTRDARWIRVCRNGGFLQLAAALGYAIWEDATRTSLLWLFYSGVYIIAINALAVHFRE